MYHETGMDCNGLILYREDIVGEPNPNFNSSKPVDGSNFPTYKSYDGIIWLKQGQILQIDNKLIVMKKDRIFSALDNYALSFYPEGFSKEELFILFNSNKKANIWTELDLSP